MSTTGAQSTTGARCTICISQRDCRGPSKGTSTDCGGSLVWITSISRAPSLRTFGDCTALGCILAKLPGKHVEGSLSFQTVEEMIVSAASAGEHDVNPRRPHFPWSFPSKMLDLEFQHVLPPNRLSILYFQYGDIESSLSQVNPTDNHFLETLHPPFRADSKLSNEWLPTSLDQFFTF